MQHVNRGFSSATEPSNFQGYMDALDYQFVLLSDQPISGEHELEVDGVLNLFSVGGGDPKTKNGYSNYEIQVNAFNCLNPDFQ